MQHVYIGDEHLFHVIDPYRFRGTYKKAQLHVHSENSIDSRWPIADIVKTYRNLGFSFVAITDHDRVTAHMETLGPPPLLVPGEENTVAWPFWPLGRHMLVLFAQTHSTQRGAQARIHSVVAGGALVAMCHPSWKGNFGAGAWSLGALRLLTGFRLIEIYNYHSNSVADVAIWDELLRERGPTNPLWAIAVDDAHHVGRAGKGWIEVKVAELSLDGLRTALERGSFYATTGPSVEFEAVGATIKVRLDCSGSGEKAPVCRFITSDGCCIPMHMEPTGTSSTVTELSASFTLSGDEGYVRVEVIDGPKCAWSQPFWIIGGAKAKGACT